jgi:hypothetical protein
MPSFRGAEIRAIEVETITVAQQWGIAMATNLTGYSASDRVPQSSTMDGVARWIYVFMAGWLLAITLTGFVPDSLSKVAAIDVGRRPPFPMILHVHAVLMAAFLLLLCAQTWLVAARKIGWHRRLGAVAAILVPALVVVGFMLAPAMYYQVLDTLQTAAPDQRAALQATLARKENIFLIQMRIGVLFPLFIALALSARNSDSGFHKRMMILGTAVAMTPAIDRILWLPSTWPGSALSSDLYVLLIVSPMFLFDFARTGRVHRAYVTWLAISLPFSLAVQSAWNTPWWHATARQMLGV